MNTKQIEVAQAEGCVLDWLVARCEGIPENQLYVDKWSGSLFRLNLNEEGELDGSYTTGPDLLFSRKWEAAGRIINRMLASPECLTIEHTNRSNPKERYVASLNKPNRFNFGPTVLVAVMRCYVASKLGSMTEIPEWIDKIPNI
jgi:hypothetical protein